MNSLEMCKEIIYGIKDFHKPDYAYSSLERIFSCPGIYAIDHFFDFLSSGAFKETYSLNQDWVVKFCSTDNYTDDEARLIDAAWEEDVGELFLPSYFIPLDIHIPLYHLNGRYSDYYCDDFSEMADYLIIQPCITATSYNRGCELLDDRFAHAYYKHPITDRKSGCAVSYTIAKHFSGQSKTWLQDVVNYYGMEVFIKFYHFIKKYKITDLHTENVGYFYDKPVIFDWCSDFNFSLQT